MFKVISTKAEAVSIDKDHKLVEGHLVSARTGIGKFDSTIYKIDTAKGPVEVWGNAQIDGSLLVGKGKKRVLQPAMDGMMIRFKWLGSRKKGKKTYNDIEVAVDPTNRLTTKGGRNYPVKSNKKPGQNVQTPLQ